MISPQLSAHLSNRKHLSLLASKRNSTVIPQTKQQTLTTPRAPITLNHAYRIQYKISPPARL